MAARPCRQRDSEAAADAVVACDAMEQFVESLPALPDGGRHRDGAGGVDDFI